HADRHRDLYAHGYANSDRDGDCDRDADPDCDCNADRHGDPDRDPNGDADADGDSNAHADGYVYTDPDADADGDQDADADTYSHCDPYSDAGRFGASHVYRLRKTRRRHHHDQDGHGNERPACQHHPEPVDCWYQPEAVREDGRHLHHVAGGTFKVHVSRLLQADQGRVAQCKLQCN
ncbi:MAG: hypothetical protein WA005_07095, partial [Candidatus Binataceae bacterium]